MSLNIRDIGSDLSSEVSSSPPTDPIHNGVAQHRSHCPSPPTAFNHGLQTHPPKTSTSQAHLREAAKTSHGKEVQSRPGEGTQDYLKGRSQETQASIQLQILQSPPHRTPHHNLDPRSPHPAPHPRKMVLPHRRPIIQHALRPLHLTRTRHPPCMPPIPLRRQETLLKGAQTRRVRGT